MHRRISLHPMVMCAAPLPQQGGVFFKTNMHKYTHGFTDITSNFKIIWLLDT
jgi:hypothetical protein